MKTISVRALTTTIKDIREPVEVVTLEKGSGQVITLGVFYPKGTSPGPVQPKPKQ